MPLRPFLWRSPSVTTSMPADLGSRQVIPRVLRHDLSLSGGGPLEISGRSFLLELAILYFLLIH